MSDVPKMVTVKQLAKSMHVSKDTVYRWIGAGLVPAMRMPGRGRWRLVLDDVLQALQTHNDQHPADHVPRGPGRPSRSHAEPASVDTPSHAAQASVHTLSHTHMSIDHILETVAKHFEITTEDIRGRSRVQKISVPRKLACYIIRKILPLLSYEDIANDLGLRDHSTIIYYVKDVNCRIKTDPILMSYLAKIVDELGLDSCQKELLTPSPDAIGDTVDK